MLPTEPLTLCRDSDDGAGGGARGEVKESLAGRLLVGERRLELRDGGAGGSSTLFDIGDSIGLDIVTPPFALGELVDSSSAAGIDELEALRSCPL